MAETLVDWDRQQKIPLYARSGVPETWLVDRKQDMITVYRDPTPGGYRTIRVVRRGERLSVAAFAERELTAGNILG